VGNGNGTVQIWDVPSGKLLRAIPGSSSHRGTIPCYAFSPDAKFALVGHDDGLFRYGNWVQLAPETLCLWDLARGRQVRAFATKGEPVMQVALSSDHRWALSTSADKVITTSTKGGHLPQRLKAVRLWDSSSGKVVRTLLQGCAGHTLPVAFSPDGALCAVGLGGRRAGLGQGKGWDVKVWHRATGREVQSLGVGEAGDVTSLAFSPHAKYIAAGSHYTVKVWDRARGKLRWSYRDPSQRWSPLSLVSSPDGKCVLAAGPETDFLLRIPAGGAKGGLVLLDAASGRREWRFAEMKEWVRSVALSADGKRIVAATGVGLRVYETVTGKLCFTFQQ
jgi:WD40 repeat protein